jgi:hypothetical protein
MNLRILIVLAGVLVAPFAARGSAHAQQEFLIPTGTTATYVGMVAGDAWAAHLRPNGCLWTPLADGDLDQTVTIKGRSTNDRMYIVTSNTTVCNNYTMSPIVTDGWSVIFLGEAGNDILVGHWAALNRAGDGNDITWSEKTAATDRGGNGNDTMFSDDPSHHLLGDAGDDALCNMYPGTHIHVQRMHGGTEVNGDTACGLAHDYVDVEFYPSSSNCPSVCYVF